MIEAGVALFSGWPENGSVNGATSAPTRAPVAVASLQWIGANSMPRCCRSLTTTLQRALPVIGGDAREAAIGHAELQRIIGMHLDERLRQMLAEPRAQAGARHGVPLIADAAGVQPQRAAPPWSRCAAPGFPARRSAPCGRW